MSTCSDHDLDKQWTLRGRGGRVPGSADPGLRSNLWRREKGAIRAAVTGQVGDPFDLPWLVFDPSQQGVAAIETYGKNVENEFNEKLHFFPFFRPVQHLSAAAACPGVSFNSSILPVARQTGTLLDAAAHSFNPENYPSLRFTQLRIQRVLHFQAKTSNHT